MNNFCPLVVSMYKNWQSLIFWALEYKMMFLGENPHIFSVPKDAAKGLAFLKGRKKFFTAADIRTIYVGYKVRA